MTQKEQTAISAFRSGYNCAQAILAAYSYDLKYDEKLALNISSGFGGGMGRMQYTCGAVTGAFMVLGIYISQKYTDIKQQKDESATLIQDYSRRFKSIHGTMDCSLLLGEDIKTETGRQLVKDRKLDEKVCEKCILDSVKILEELIGNE